MSIAMITPGQIRAARSLIGAKQSELARAAGISLATLNNIERGVGDPRASTLDSIAAALARAGITLASEAERLSVTLKTVLRPRCYDTYQASERILETLGPHSLARPERLVFFARRSRHPEDLRPRICVFIEARGRAILYDEVDFNLEGGSRVAEVAGIMLAAFAFHRPRLRYIDEVLEDTTRASALETVLRLRALGGATLVHPRQFFDVFDDWEGRLSAFASRHGHPMRDLVEFSERSALSTKPLR